MSRRDLLAQWRRPGARSRLFRYYRSDGIVLIYFGGATGRPGLSQLQPARKMRAGKDARATL